jgi:hypothetical protein
MRRDSVPKQQRDDQDAGHDLRGERQQHDRQHPHQVEQEERHVIGKVTNRSSPRSERTRAG